MPKIRALLQYTTQAWEQKKIPVAEREVPTLGTAALYLQHLEQHCTLVVQTSCQLRWALPSTAVEREVYAASSPSLGQTSELDTSGSDVGSHAGASNKSWVAPGSSSAGAVGTCWASSQPTEQQGSAQVRNWNVYSPGLVETQTSSFYIRSDFCSPLMLTSDAPLLFQNDEDYQSAAQVYDTPAVFLHPVLELVFR